MKLWNQWIYYLIAHSECVVKYVSYCQEWEEKLTEN